MYRIGDIFGGRVNSGITVKGLKQTPNSNDLGKKHTKTHLAILFLIHLIQEVVIQDTTHLYLLNGTSLPSMSLAVKSYIDSAFSQSVFSLLMLYKEKFYYISKCCQFPNKEILQILTILS